jgi:hypothetical protein
MAVPPFYLNLLCTCLVGRRFTCSRTVMNIWLKIGFSERQLSATFLPLFKELASGRRSQPILYGLGLCGVTRDQKEQRRGSEHW